MALAQLELPELATSAKPQDLTLEATYSDRTVPSRHCSRASASGRRQWWQGIRTEGWISVDKDLKLQLALDTRGKPQGQCAAVGTAIAHTTTTSRKRLVGGLLHL